MTTGLLLALLCAGFARAQEAGPKDPKEKKDFFGQPSIGMYNANDSAFGAGLVLGNRYGWYVRPHFHVGVVLDWYSAREDVAVLQGTQRVVRDAVFDYFPLLGYVQWESGTSSRFIPYAGGGLGYQLAFVEGTNFETEIFDGWGWGGWAGMQFRFQYEGKPLPGGLSVEVFYNSAEVSRMADVPGTGARTREFVEAGGIGARLGFWFRARHGK